MTAPAVRIVVGIDRTRHSRDALGLAEAILGERKGWLAVAHVYSHLVVPASPNEIDDAQSPRHAAERWLEQSIGRVDTPATGYAISDPSPANALHQLARDVGAEMIVIGSSHRGHTGRVMLGDDGARTVHDAPCPVALAPSGWRTARRLGVISVAYDGSDESRLAVGRAATIARAADARLRLVHVVPEARDYDAGVALLQGQVDRLGEAAEGEVRIGRPIDALAAAANDTDLLVIGSRSRGVLRRVLGGSTSIGLMQRATCPILITPRGPEIGERFGGSVISRMAISQLH